MEPQEAKKTIRLMYKGQPTQIQKEALETAYNALDRLTEKRPSEMHLTKFAGCMRPNYIIGKCPYCKEDVDTITI